MGAFEKYRDELFHNQYYYVPCELDRPFRVNIINYEGEGWILSKFEKKLVENLQTMGVDAKSGSKIDDTADINHHIQAENVMSHLNKYHTVMISHMDSQWKIKRLRKSTRAGAMGICMSKDTMNQLAILGIDRTRLCYINPAHDKVIAPKKYVLGITSRIYGDNRKKEAILIDVCKNLDPRFFKFKIMGAGWKDIVAEVRNMGFEVEYHDEFDYDEYVMLMPSLDYFLYWGFDEGTMGYLDALHAGVKTIVTPQGYHLDARDGITHACSTIAEFVDVLQSLERERKKIISSVEEWTWYNYAMKHLEVWQYLTKTKPLVELLDNRSRYSDGIFSVILSNVSDSISVKEKIMNKLYKND